MPKRTSKILLVRLTANKNAFFLRYELRVSLVTQCDLALRVVIKIPEMTYLLSLQLRTLTGFHLEASFGVIFPHGVYQNVNGFHFSLKPQFLISLCITTRKEHDELFD